MKWVMLTMIVGLILVGAYGAMSAHGTQASVETSVSVVEGNSTVQQVTQGESVKIVVTVSNNGNSVFKFSGSAPASAYANIYLINNGVKTFVEKVSFVPRYVMDHVIFLNPGEKYTAKISWTVPTNVTGEVEIDAWAGSAPAGSTDVQIVGPNTNVQSAHLTVSTDAQGYEAGDTVEIYVENDGARAVLLSEGFEIYDASGNVVVNVTWYDNVELQPGQTLVYYWNIPSYMPSGWYYVHPYGTNQYVEIYIF
ncbi:MAG: hypothetical protein GXO25_08230 [Euryarchaeota archaeon]|nr:hypothetical protein [Euryarchaeota archaeon]